MVHTKRFDLAPALIALAPTAHEEYMVHSGREYGIESGGQLPDRLAPVYFLGRLPKDTQSRSTLGVKWGQGRGGEEKGLFNSIE